MTPLPLVFIPGMMSDARLYEHQIVSLSQRYPEHISSVYNKDSVREMAKEVLEYAPPRFVLIGLSMGGVVAMEILAQAGRLKQLMLEQVIPMLHLEGENGVKIADTFLSMALGLGKDVFERQSRALQNRQDPN